MDIYKYNPNIRMDSLVYMARFWEVRMGKSKFI